MFRNLSIEFRGIALLLLVIIVGIVSTGCRDTSPPIVTIVKPEDGSMIKNNTPELIYIIDDSSATVKVEVDGMALNKKSGNSLDPLTGEHTLKVTAIDESGNIGYATSTFTVVFPSIRESESICDVGKFDIALSSEGVLSLVYCNEEGEDIFYRCFLPNGDWAPVELIKAEWNGKFKFEWNGEWHEWFSKDFSIDVDPSGNPHIICEDVQGLFYAYANKSRTHEAGWNNINITARDFPDYDYYDSLGRIHAIKIDNEGNIGIVATRNYLMYGKYVFSDLAFITVNDKGVSGFEHIKMTDEDIWGLDINYDSSGNPIFVVAQDEWGGSKALKIVFRSSSDEWTERELRSKWGLCVKPVKIVIGSYIHIMSCNTYLNLLSKEGEINERYMVGSGLQDLTLAEDNIYMAYVEDEFVRIMTVKSGELVSLLVDFQESTTDTHFVEAKVDYANNEIVICYLDSNNSLKVKFYSITDIQAYFDDLSEMPLLH